MSCDHGRATGHAALDGSAALETWGPSVPRKLEPRGPSLSQGKLAEQEEGVRSRQCTFQAKASANEQFQFCHLLSLLICPAMGTGCMLLPPVSAPPP